MCSPSVVPIVVSTCMRACTALGMYGPSGVLVAHTVFGMGSVNDVPIVRKPACLGVHTVRVRVQCLAWAA